MYVRFMIKNKQQSLLVQDLAQLTQFFKVELMKRNQCFIKKKLIKLVQSCNFNLYRKINAQINRNHQFSKGHKKPLSIVR